MTAEAIVGIDLGGTQIRAVLATPEGTILARYKTLTAADEGQAAVLERIVRAAEAVMQQGRGRQPRGIGVGSAGAVDPHSGTVLAATNLGWFGVPLQSILSERLALPAVVGNDANAAALAERRFGAGRGADNLIYITISTGVGAGIISGGCLLLGTRGLAGEVGHVAIEPEGPPCPCGNRGCLEALASGPAIARAALARISGGEVSSIAAIAGGDLAQVSAETVARAAAEGDAVAADIIRRAGFYIGICLVNLIHILEPQLILIGGGVAQIGALLFDPIRETVRERAIPAMREGLRIEPAALGDDVGVLGAIALFEEYGRG